MRSTLSRACRRPFLWLRVTGLIQHRRDCSRFAVVAEPLPPELVQARYVPAKGEARLALLAA